MRRREINNRFIRKHQFACCRIWPTLQSLEPVKISNLNDQPKKGIALLIVKSDLVFIF